MFDWIYRENQLAHAMETWVARMSMIRPEEVETLPLETRGFTDRLDLRVRTNCYVLIELMKLLTETFSVDRICIATKNRKARRADISTID